MQGSAPSGWSGWEVYYVVFLSALLALGIPVLLRLLSRLLSSGRVDQSEPANGFRSEVIFGRKINTRFFLGSNAAMVLITLALILIPCSVTLSSLVGGDHEAIIESMIGIITVGAVSALGLLYSSRKGDLNWLRSYQSDSKKGAK